jgi:hypothetical protein
VTLLLPGMTRYTFAYTVGGSGGGGGGVNGFLPTIEGFLEWFSAYNRGKLQKDLFLAALPHLFHSLSVVFFVFSFPYSLLLV